MNQEWRMVELRPGVFSIEKRSKALSWLLNERVLDRLNWWGDWKPYEGYLIPCIPEYSPTAVIEYTREEAEERIRLDREAYETQRLRENPPPGYPRIHENT